MSFSSTAMGTVAMWAPASCFCKVSGMAETCGDDLGFDPVFLKDLGNFANYTNSVVADVIQPAEKGTDVRGACSGSKERLIGREN